MAEAVVETRRPIHRFFCHRCNVEFEDVLQDYTCPFCSSGFIERLEHDDSSQTVDDEEYSDADMSNLEDASHLEDSFNDSLDDLTRGNNAPGQPVLNDLAFLMTGGRLRAAGPRRGEGRTLMEQLVWMIGGGRGAGAVTAGAPFVLVGAPGDYVVGGEGLDAVVTHLLGQMENSGPPPLPREQIQAIPSEQITEAQVEAVMACSVCWDNFTLGETVSRLPCEHIFHPACITPWLQLHATCPICRRSLMSEQQTSARPAAAPSESVPATASDVTTSAPPPAASTTAPAAQPAPAPREPTRSFGRIVFGRVGSRRRRSTQTAGGSDTSSSGSRTAAGLWSGLTSLVASDTDVSPSVSSVSSDRDRDRDQDSYMDIDYD